MSDVQILYAVTAVVLVGLLVWAGVVLATAPDAPDESPVDGRAGDPAPGIRRALEPKAGPPVVIHDETPPPSTVEVSSPSERSVAIGGKSAPVVVLPVMRSRLDSHSEISDHSSAPPPATGSPVVEERPNVHDSAVPPAGPPFSLVSAIGRSEPAQGPTEMSAIVDRHRLFILADGGGQRIQDELVSAVVADALASAFEIGSDASYPAHTTLPRRADRLRRSLIASLTVLEARGGAATGTPLDMSRVAVLAAHFSPDNRRLYIATAGADRAYRLRDQEVVHLNKPGLAPGGGDGPAVETVSLETAPDDVYVFGSDKAFLALGDELRTVLTSDPSIDRVAAHFVAAATREGKSTGMTAIVVRINTRPASMRPEA